MQPENPEVAAVGISAAAGLAGGAIVALSQEEITYRKLFYTLLSSSTLGFFGGPYLAYQCQLPWFYAGGFALAIGLSCLGLIPVIQAISVKVAKQFEVTKIGGGSP